jgi:hypothetical protein
LAPIAQRRESAQLAQLPPQSRSVSSPFLIWSSQADAAHWLAAQTPLWQSLLPPQPWPVSQVAPQTPPQSIADSS